MATTHPLPPPAGEQTHEFEVAAGPEMAAEQAIVPSLHPPAEGGFIALNSPLARLPVELDVAVPIRQFRVRNLLSLAPGQVVESQWGNGEDVPLASGAVQLTWSEFEVIDARLAVRITRLV